MTDSPVTCYLTAQQRSELLAESRYLNPAIFGARMPSEGG